MSAYYNENDPFAVQTLRNLIAAGHIAPGIVDDRSIEEVTPSDLDGFTQCHFFAGIGVWSYSIRKAGWSDDRPIWSASCPCQPFSDAGKGGGIDDPRHLWPSFYRLAKVKRPGVIVGEQVASKDGLAWIDIVYTDLENEGYAVGAVDTCSASIGAPHIRQRLRFVALGDSYQSRLERQCSGHSAASGQFAKPAGSITASSEFGVMADEYGNRRDENRLDRGQTGRDGFGGNYSTSVMADRNGGECGGQSIVGGLISDGHDAGRSQGGSGVTAHSENDHMGNAISINIPEISASNDAVNKQWSTIGRRAIQFAGNGTDGGICGGDNIAGSDGGGITGNLADMARPGPVNGFWRASDWLYCRDDKWRAVEPGTFPLAHGLPRSLVGSDAGLRGLAELANLDEPSLRRAKAFRKGALRAYGNAVDADATVDFMRAVTECL